MIDDEAVRVMSGLFGYFSAIPKHDAILGVAKTLGYTITETKASSDSLVCLLENQSKTNDEVIIDFTTGNYLVFCGEIYNRDIPDLKQFLFDICQQGEFEKLRRINGSFLAAIYDHKKNAFFLINDRFGSKKLFYSFEKDCLYFSPKISPLMSLLSKKKIRKDALVDFLIFGYYLGDKTFDENIFQLPPGSILEASAQGVTVKPYWTYPLNDSGDSREKDLQLDELGVRWQNAVDSRIKENEKIIVEISGGLDSRAILAAALLMTSKENILLYTFGDEKSYDCEIGKNIAKTFGIQHVYLPAVKKDFADQYEKSFHDVEGMIDATPYFSIQIDQSLRKCGTRIFNGFMGGEIMGPLIFSKIDNLDLSANGEYGKAKEMLFNHHRMNDIQTITSLFNKSWLKETTILSSFEKSVEDLKFISTKEFPNYCAKWLYMNEADKYTAFCNFRYDTVFEYVKPFLDNDLIDFMMQAPVEFRKEKKLYKKMLMKKYPDLFRLPTKNNLGLPLHTNPVRLYVKRVLWFLQLKLNLLSNRIVHHRLFFNKNQNFIDYDDLLRTNIEYQMFVKTMVEKVKKQEFFNPEYIDQLWLSHLTGKKNVAMIFGLLVTVELILEKFYDPART
jgi:asparagine synthase (glutamine-hydrolysing)